MNTKLVIWRGIYILLLNILMCSVSVAQSESSEKRDYDCDFQPLGLFYQVVDSVIDVRGSGESGSIFLSSESDIQERRYTLEAIDEVVPRYKLVLTRGASERSETNRCAATIKIDGKLIAPSGKWFEFTEATYNFPSYVLKFTTEERDGITYKAEAKISVETMAGMGWIENVKLKASGKSLGIVLMEFSMR